MGDVYNTDVEKVNEVPHVNRVLYDIMNKSLATLEIELSQSMKNCNPNLESRESIYNSLECCRCYRRMEYGFNC
jgi:hypothetical protein